MKRTVFLASFFALIASLAPVQADDLDLDFVTSAAHGDRDALHDFFEHSLEERPGSGSHVYESQLRELFSAIGSARFTVALKAESTPVQRRVMLLLNSAMSNH